MSHISILDCTLREAPIEGLDWGEMSKRRLANGLSDAGIEYVECGFLKDDEYVEGSAIYNSPTQVTGITPSADSRTQYTLLVDYGRYDLEKLPQNNNNAVDIIRICFKKDEIDYVLDYAKKIQDKGYKVCIQHVNTAAYSDEEIVKFVKEVNKIKPYSYSVVDTFGSMYWDELIRIGTLVDKYLDSDIILGVHTHNNLMQANVNSQLFASNIASENRKVIIDSSLFGCGRGAGNANTELIAEFLNKKKKRHYDIDVLLDIIDSVINAAKKKASWGYSIPYFIAGCNDAHSFNVKYLIQRHNIQSKDLKNIIASLSDKQKKQYNYRLLDELYFEYFNYEIDDSEVYKRMHDELVGKKVLLLAPGKSIVDEAATINKYIHDENPVIFGVNNLIKNYKQDYVFYSGVRRYELLSFEELANFGNPEIIKTSNIRKECNEKEMVLDYSSLVKLGWTYFDSSVILLLRFLFKCGVKDFNIAGLDGYLSYGNAFYDMELETALVASERSKATVENAEMIKDFLANDKTIKLKFITKSMYEEMIKNEQI